MKSDREGYYLVNEVKSLLGCTDSIFKLKILEKGVLKFKQFEEGGFRYFAIEDVLKLKEVIDARRIAAKEHAAAEEGRLVQEYNALTERQRELLELKDKLKKSNLEYRNKIYLVEEQRKAKAAEAQRLRQLEAYERRELAASEKREANRRLELEKKQISSLPVDMQMFIKDSERLGFKWKGVNCTGYLSKCPGCGWHPEDGRALFVSYDVYDGFMLSCSGYDCSPDRILGALELVMLRIDEG